MGRYRVRIEAPQFAPSVQDPVQVSVGETVRLLVQLELASLAETVTVDAGASLVDATSNTQLGLLHTGVAPLTAGLATAGGTLRQGQAYAVNGMRPEQNAYLVDGGLNNNRMDGGYACAGAVGPVLMGRAFDAQGSYERLLVWMASGTAVTGLLMLTLSRGRAHASSQTHS